MITIDEIVKRDLYKEIRTYTDYDDSDWPLTFEPPIEVSVANIDELSYFFNMKKSECKSILEIGVASKLQRSFTNFFIENKLNGTKYFGVDKEDRSFINDSAKNIYTIKTDSANIFEVKSYLKEHGIDKVDFIFVDSWASVNQVLADWLYIELLSDDGIIAFHDTNFHPGPSDLVNNLKQDKYEVYKKCVSNQDWGITFITKKI
jgi:hypothetical protein